MKRNILLIIVLILITLMSTPVWANDGIAGKYFIIKDYQNHQITMLGHSLSIGDRYLNSDNRLYQIDRIQGKVAYAKLVRLEKLKLNTVEQMKAWVGMLFAQAKASGTIGIYHTHSDESYTPNDGVSSKKGQGGIYQIGAVLTKKLEEEGIPVVHDQTIHGLHDASAYDRSRRTAVNLLKNQPSALIDVHRDAVPAELYSKTINNQQVSRIQLVVGRQNPNFASNNAFAKQLKAAVDQKYPGLVKGIFYGKGKYNQDLGPKAILIEVGTDKTNKGAAERGVALFAAAAKDQLYTKSSAVNQTVNRSSFKSVFWILAALVIGVAFFLLINHKGLGEIGKEFTGAIGEAEVGTGEEEEKQKESGVEEP